MRYGDVVKLVYTGNTSSTSTTTSNDQQYYITTPPEYYTNLRTTLGSDGVELTLIKEDGTSDGSVLSSGDTSKFLMTFQNNSTTYYVFPQINTLTEGSTTYRTIVMYTTPTKSEAISGTRSFYLDMRINDNWSSPGTQVPYGSTIYIKPFNTDDAMNGMSFTNGEVSGDSWYGPLICTDTTEYGCQTTTETSTWKFELGTPSTSS
jgi:hypothetical protein